MTDTWVPVARRDTAALANNATGAVQTVGWDGRNLAEGEVCGVSVTVNASAGAGHSVRVRLYTETALTNLMYDTTIDLSASTSGTDTLAMPIPLFAQNSSLPAAGTPTTTTPSVHTYTVTDIGGGGAKTYSVLFFVRATT
jgi:hypothetical protein